LAQRKNRTVAFSYENPKGSSYLLLSQKKGCLAEIINKSCKIIRKEDFMVVECCCHEQNFGFPLIIGTKEPILDTSITSGICGDCLIIEEEKIKIVNYHAKSLKLPSTIKNIFHEEVNSSKGDNHAVVNHCYSWSIDRSYSVGYRALQDRRGKRARRREIMGSVFVSLLIIGYIVLRIV